MRRSFAALIVAGLAQDLAEGLERGAAAIDTGAARAALERLAQLSAPTEAG